MALTNIVLLCPPADGRHLTTVLSLHNPRLAITAVSTRTELEAALQTVPPNTRLIAFSTNVVVPAGILERLPGPAYNFHPGPPAYPGRHPVAFALYDRVARYGATAHEMAARTDSGPIVGSVEFPVPPGATADWLNEQAYGAMIRLFLLLAQRLATSHAPLPHAPLAWGEKRCSRKAFEAMRQLQPDINQAELERRLAAFNPQTGEGAPFITLHGRRFVLES